jgi:hypothetical protein
MRCCEKWQSQSTNAGRARTTADGSAINSEDALEKQPDPVRETAIERWFSARQYREPDAAGAGGVGAA